MLTTRLKKNVAIALLSTMAITAVPMPLMAEVLDTSKYQEQVTMIQPRLQYIGETMNGFGISSGIARIDCWVRGDVLDATKAKVIAELQVKNGSSWIPVEIWTDTQNDYRASVYEEYPVDAGKTYRVKATFYVWEGSQSESLIVISDEKP